jgi:hypothetical protein
MTQGLVVFAKRKKRVSAFYQQTLDLELVESDCSHDLLRGHGLEVVVHTIPPRIAKNIEVNEPPVLRQETPLKPTFVVASLAAVRSSAEATGGVSSRNREHGTSGATRCLTVGIPKAMWCSSSRPIEQAN